MSADVRVFAAGVARKRDDGTVSVTVEAWSTEDAAKAAAVLEAVRAVLGEPDEECLLDDTASRKLHLASTEIGMVKLKAEPDEAG